VLVIVSNEDSLGQASDAIRRAVGELDELELLVSRFELGGTTGLIEAMLP
jgi:hypothetical protein